MVKKVMYILNMFSEAVNTYAPHILLVIILIELVTILIPYIIDPGFYAANFKIR